MFLQQAGTSGPYPGQPDKFWIIKPEGALKTTKKMSDNQKQASGQEMEGYRAGPD